MVEGQAKPEALEVVKYTWWEGTDPPPNYLKTQKQLSNMGLAPVSHVGVIVTKKYDLKLYDPNNEKSVRKKRKASPAQLAALKKRRLRTKFKRAVENWTQYDSCFETDRVSAVRWARNALNNPDRWRILDTETSGLSSYCDRIVEIAITDLKGMPLLDSVVRPVGDWQMSAEAAAVHDISAHEIAQAPLFSEIYSQLVEATDGRTLITYGANFDSKMLDAAIRRADLSPLRAKWFCLMERYAEWYGEWDFQHDNYTWQPLGGSHRALGDCQTALKRLQSIAEDNATFQYPQWLIQMAEEVGEDLPEQ